MLAGLLLAAATTYTTARRIFVPLFTARLLRTEWWRFNCDEGMYDCTSFLFPMRDAPFTPARKKCLVFLPGPFLVDVPLFKGFYSCLFAFPSLKWMQTMGDTRMTSSLDKWGTSISTYFNRTYPTCYGLPCPCLVCLLVGLYCHHRIEATSPFNLL